MKKRGIVSRSLRFLLRTILWVLGSILLYFLGVLIFMFIPANSDYKQATEGVPLYLISNGIHLDVCIPREALDPEMARQLEAYGNNSDLVSFGWGDKDFFLHTPSWAELKASTAFKSLFVPTATAMHVTFYNTPPKKGSRVVKLLLRAEEVRRLNAFLKTGFEPNKAGDFQSINCCAYSGVANTFFEGSGSYHLFQTCNTWSNAAVKAAGVKTALWTPLDKGILHHYLD